MFRENGFIKVTLNIKLKKSILGEAKRLKAYVKDVDKDPEKYLITKKVQAWHKLWKVKKQYIDKNSDLWSGRIVWSWKGDYIYVRKNIWGNALYELESFALNTNTINDVYLTPIQYETLEMVRKND